MLDKLLTAKTRIDTHQKHHINITDNVLQHRYWRRGIQGDTSLHASIMYLLYSTMKMHTGFVMDIHHHGTQITNLLDELLGLDNHQMYIQRFITYLRHRFHHRKTERDIGYEHSIHHIEMQPVGITTIYHIHLTSKVAEISG